MTLAVCPSCGETIDLQKQLKVGQKVTCRYCGELLEVVDVNPMELDWAYYEEEEKEDDKEDWEDEDWDDED